MASGRASNGDGNGDDDNNSNDKGKERREGEKKDVGFPTYGGKNSSSSSNLSFVEQKFSYLRALGKCQLWSCQPWYVRNCQVLGRGGGNFQGSAGIFG